MASTRFLADAAAAGVDGLIVVDLPPEEDDELCLPALKPGLDFIRLATPTTDDKRLPAVLNNTSGFVYYVSIAGITGIGRARRRQGQRRGGAHQAAYRAAGARWASASRPPSRHAPSREAPTAWWWARRWSDALRASLDNKGKAGAGTVKAVTSLVSALADGVRSARARGRRVAVIILTNPAYIGEHELDHQVVRPKIRSLSGAARRRKISGSNARPAAQMIFHRDLEANQFVIPNSDYHMRIGPARG